MTASLFVVAALWKIRKYLNVRQVSGMKKRFRRVLPLVMLLLPACCPRTAFLLKQCDAFQRFHLLRATRRFLRERCAGASSCTHPSVSALSYVSRLSSTAAWAQPVPDFVEHHDDTFLRPLETTIQQVLQKYDEQTDIMDVPPTEREALGIARNLHVRLQAFRRNDNCPRCWLQRAHCICLQCPPLPEQPQNRIFVLMHHKEVCLTVDTAKLILAAFPQKARLVVGGLGPDVQSTMQEMMQALAQQHDNNLIVLFPDEDAETYQSLSDSFQKAMGTMDLIVLDGTWEQARRLYKRYIPARAAGGPPRVKLTAEALATLQPAAQRAKDESSSLAFTGRQLRRHPEWWREISTLTATRLLLSDMDDVEEKNRWDSLADYQECADRAAREQLGAPRPRQIRSIT